MSVQKMRGVLLAAALILLVLSSVNAQQQICGNSIVEPSEECDDGNTVNGDGCSANCLSEKEIHYVLYDLAINHNLLFSKVQDLLHISKDSAIQDETKVLQSGLLRAFFNPPNGNPCQVVPVIFAMPSSLHPYGKLNEINALNGLWLFAASNPSNRAALGIGDLQFTSASGMESDAEALVQGGSYLLAAQEKCCVYAQLAFPDSLSFDPATGICNRCGDSIIAGDEECDPPNSECPGGGTCDSVCQCPNCGNNQIDGSEDCDGTADSACPGQCTGACTCPSCGNNQIEGNEECDGTSDNACPGQCTGACTCPSCGNNQIEGNEECDDGNNVDGDGCNSDCMNEFCGDGTTQTGLGEQCDDGNTIDGDGCNSNCKNEFCGDGILQSGLGEECDDGNNANGDGCNSNCQTEFCGDETTQTGLGEECDPPSSECSGGGTCDNECQCPNCGNNQIDGSEDCDGTADSACPGQCTGACTCPSCGDNVLDSGEECDDGNNVDDDGCNADCQDEFCGDGIIQPGEQCEPPNVGSCDANCKTGRGKHGGSNPQLQFPGCADGSEYNLIEWLKRNRSPVGFVGGTNWYYIDNGGTKWQLVSQQAITVGPMCCADCCSSYCSVLNSRWLCLPPVIYDEKGTPVMLEAPSVCRPAVLPLDSEVCKDLGGLRCLRREVPASVASETMAVVAGSSLIQIAGCVNTEDCTAGFICQDGACVRPQSAVQEPKVIGVSRLVSSNFAAMTGMLIVVLAVLAFVLFNLRSKKQGEKPEPVIVKPVEKQESKPVKTEQNTAKYDSAKLETDLDDLDKSHKKIEQVLKSIRGKV